MTMFVGKFIFIAILYGEFSTSMKREEKNVISHKFIIIILKYRKLK